MAEKNKMTTAEQLKMLALRAKADSTARISELAALIVAGYGHGITITLSAANWNGRTQEIRRESFLAESNFWYFVCGDAGCFAEYSDAGVKADNVTVNGQMTFRCEITPESDLTVNILRLEVDIDEQQT